MVELGGRPLLEWQTASLSLAGVEEVAIVTGWRRELLEGRVSSTFHNKRWMETNMVMSMVCAAKWLEAEPCIVSYSDIFYPPQAVTSLMACKSDIALTYDPNWLELWSRRFSDPLLDAETFRIDAKARIIEIGNKTKRVEDIEGQYMGLLYFTPTGWNSVRHFLEQIGPTRCDKLDMTSLLSELIEGGASIQAIPIRGRWGEVDSGSDLAIYDEDFQQGRISFPHKSDTPDINS